jgi:polysaccharide deacetylase 2 family uncharacterized protein YibQ
VKKTVKKPRGVKKPKAGTSAKKKRRRKLGTADRLRAVLAAAVIILVGVISFLAVVHLNRAKARNEALAQSTETGQIDDNAGNTAIVQTVSVAAGQASPAVTTSQTPAAIPPPSQPVPPPARSQPVERTLLVNAVPSRPAPAVTPVPAAVVERPKPQRGTLVFVIDDAGNNLRDLEPFLKFPGPLTIAVLPGLPYSAEAARRVRAAGKEVFLHQPMEALGGSNPGPGAIMAGMRGDEIRALVNRNLDEIWPVAGINNHEGSRITMDGEAMETILTVCRERGILFLDSRTTAETAAPAAARRLGMRIGERDVFVDNSQERDSMIGYINTGLARAEQRGSAIMIGHVWSPALAPLLAELFTDLQERGFSFSSVSNLIRTEQ